MEIFQEWLKIFAFFFFFKQDMVICSSIENALKRMKNVKSDMKIKRKKNVKAYSVPRFFKLNGTIVCFLGIICDHRFKRLWALHRDPDHEDFSVSERGLWKYWGNAEIKFNI